jgi:hypothetical protein
MCYVSEKNAKRPTDFSLLKIPVETDIVIPIVISIK